MGKLTIKIYAPIDIETKERYFISPKSGSMYRINPKEENWFYSFLLYLDGIRRVENIIPDPIENTQDFSINEDLHLRFKLAKAKKIWLDDLWNKIQNEAEYLSLDKLARKIKFRDNTLPILNPKEVIYLANNYKKKEKDNCLIHSFWQASILQWHNIDCNLFIGVWIPLADAHAWVTIKDFTNGGNSIVLGDTCDDIMHYSPTLEFIFR